MYSLQTDSYAYELEWKLQDKTGQNVKPSETEISYFFAGNSLK